MVLMGVIVMPEKRCLLRTYSVNDIDEIKRLLLQFLVFKKQGEPEKPIEFKVNLNPV